MRKPIYRMMCVFSNTQRLQYNAWYPTELRAVVADREESLFDFFERNIRTWLKTMDIETGLQHCKPRIIKTENAILMDTWRLTTPIHQKWMKEAALTGFELWNAYRGSANAFHEIVTVNKPLMIVNGLDYHY